MDNSKFQELVLQQLQALNAGQRKLEDKMGSLEDRIDAVEKGQQRLEMRMETEVINKVRVLFDAHELHEDKFKRVFNKLESIETDTGYLVTKVARLEQLVAK